MSLLFTRAAFEPNSSMGRSVAMGSKPAATITLLSGAPGVMRRPPLNAGSVAGTLTAEESISQEATGLVAASSNPMRRRSVESRPFAAGVELWQLTPQLT